MCGFAGNSRVQLLDVYELDREGEATSFSKHADKQGRRLLWHGKEERTVYLTREIGREREKERERERERGSAWLPAALTRCPHVVPCEIGGVLLLMAGTNVATAAAIVSSGLRIMGSGELAIKRGTELVHPVALDHEQGQYVPAALLDDTLPLPWKCGKWN